VLPPNVDIVTRGEWQKLLSVKVSASLRFEGDAESHIGALFGDRVDLDISSQLFADTLADGEAKTYASC